MAVKHSSVKDEPIKDMLGNINSTLIQRLLERSYAGDASQIPIVDYLGARPTSSVAPFEVKCTQEANTVVYEFGDKLPAVASWLETLAGPSLNWLRALVASNTIVQGTSYIDNPLRRLLIPRSGQKVVVKYNGASPSSIVIYGAARSFGVHDPSFKAVEIQYNEDTKLIELTMFEERRNVSVPLSLQFRYLPSMGFAPIHEIANGRTTRIKEFYWKLWYGDDASLPDLDIHDTFTGPETVIDASEVEQFCAVVGNQGESFKTTRNDEVHAPMDFAIVTGWQVSSSMIGSSFTYSSSFAGNHEVDIPLCDRR